jgi:hypothetical protein
VTTPAPTECGDRGRAPAGDIQRTAVISDCGRYRYSLGRRWGRGPVLAWVMLNPSTADAEVDDPTIRRCIGYGRAWGFEGIVDLFALRATYPREVSRAAEPIGPANDETLLWASCADWVMAAWGAHPWARRRAADVYRLIGGEMLCLGTTRDGSPPAVCAEGGPVHTLASAPGHGGPD